MAAGSGSWEWQSGSWAEDDRWSQNSNRNQGGDWWSTSQVVPAASAAAPEGEPEVDRPSQSHSSTERVTEGVAEPKAPSQSHSSSERVTERAAEPKAAPTPRVKAKPKPKAGRTRPETQPKNRMQPTAEGDSDAEPAQEDWAQAQNLNRREARETQDGINQACRDRSATYTCSSCLEKFYFSEICPLYQVGSAGKEISYKFVSLACRP